MNRQAVGAVISVYCEDQDIMITMLKRLDQFQAKRWEQQLAIAFNLFKLIRDLQKLPVSKEKQCQ